MLYHNVQVTAHALRFIDSAALVVSGSAAWLVGITTGNWAETSAQSLAVFVVAVIVGFVSLGSRLHIYHARRTEEVASEFFLLAEVAVFAIAAGCLAAELLTVGIPGRIYAGMVPAMLVTLLGLRLVMRLVIRRLRRKGGDARNWLIVGHNRRAASIANEVLHNPQYGIRIQKIVDIADRGGVKSKERLLFEAAPPAGVELEVIDDVERLREIVSELVIDEVVVTLPVRSQYDTVSRILEICCGAGISVRMRPQAFETVGYATELSYVGKIPMIAHYSGPSNYGHLLVKRVIDVIGSGAGLLLLSPLFVAIAAAIKLGSPGPVLFRQTRMGLHGRHFEMIKFRSMVKDAPLLRDQLASANERDGTAFKIRNDSRITPLGRWLRAYHMDELPQLWNVLVGDMSLVGPRPLPVKEAQGNEWWQRRRLTMPPGLTCFWQLEDDPNMPFREWMRLDMAYIDRWSLWLDLKLIVRTFGTVLRGNGW